MPVIPFSQHTPSIGNQCWVAPTAFIIGDVHVAEQVSFFFGAVARGDINPIVIGKGSNIQENALLHTSHGLGPCTIGEDVTIGHSAIVHGATVEQCCIIGMHSTILDGAVIGSESIVGANSLVTMNTTFPPRSLILGAPAKAVRTLREDEVQQIRDSAASYRVLSTFHNKIL